MTAQNSDDQTAVLVLEDGVIFPAQPLGRATPSYKVVAALMGLRIARP